MATPPQADGKGWATTGLLKTPGIPAPTGQYSVGCVDVMTKDNLLVRLYYPTRVQDGQGYQYVSASPGAKYIKALCEIYNVRPAWLFSAIFSKLTG